MLKKMNDGIDEDDSGTSSSVIIGHESIPYNPRASRNLAEKQRRDNLNTNISTMAALVPTVAGSSRRMDKISILRLAAAFLRTQYTLGRSSTNYFPPQLNEFDLEQYFVDHLVGSRGFFLVVTTKGKIVYVSRQVEQHLGHVQNELLGQSLYNFVYPGDYKTLTENLTPDGMQPIYPSQNGIQAGSELSHDSSSSSSEDSGTTQRSERSKFFCEQRRSFQIRMSQRTVSKREQPQYERFDISGVLRLAEACKNADSNRGKHRESTSNDIVFAGVATLPKKRPITELSIMDANKNEYVTRHLLDGHIIYCDHRVSVVAGYMSEEVTGANAFKFMHKDDSKWTILGLRQMYDRSEPFGSSCYRLLTKTGNYIYLRTHGYLEYDKDTQKIISFVCINTLVSEDEGIRLIQEMKGRFSNVTGADRLFLQDSDRISSSAESLSASPSTKSEIEDSTLEEYIAYLIDGLSSPIISDDNFPQSLDAQYTKYAKAVALSTCIPPAITQGGRIYSDNGKNKHYSRYLQDKQQHRAQQVKQEYKEHKYASEKLLSPNSARQSPASDAEDVKPLSGTTLLTSDDVNVAHGSRSNIQSATFVQSTVLLARKSGTKSRRSHNYIACLDAIQNINVPDVQRRVDYVNANVVSSSILYNGVTGNVKTEPDIGRFICLDKESSVLHYLGNADGVVSAGIEAHERWPLKRICSEEDLTAYTKKRSGEAEASYASTSASDEHQDYGNSFTAESEYPQALSIEYSQYDGTDTQQLATAESPGVNISEIGNCQQMMEPAATPLEVANPELGLLDLTDLKEDLLLNSDLETDPEFMMKIFDTLNNGSTTNLDDNPMKANVQQLVPDDQAVNDEIRRTYYQLANSMALRESQINVLARDLENPALCAQRKNLSQLQAEHNRQKQMLKTLQQDHHKMQVNVAKQNVEA